MRAPLCCIHRKPATNRQATTPRTSVPRGIFTMIATVLVLAAAIASHARVFWLPLSGPLYHKPHHYETYRVALIPLDPHSKATGYVHLYGNGGDDADRLALRATGLPPDTRCEMWFSNEQKHTRMGRPLVVHTDATGLLHFTVYGSFCDVKHYPDIIIVIGRRLVLQANLVGPQQKWPPTASPGPASVPTGKKAPAVPASKPAR